MPPNELSSLKQPYEFTSRQTGVIFESDSETPDGGLKNEEKLLGYRKADKRPLKIVWFNVIFVIYAHFGAMYGLYLFFVEASWTTFLFTIILYSAGIVGATAGVHRLWSHRSYKAKWPLRFILMIFQTINFQDPIFHWARDHRVHHKYSDTDADPHNATRGFFFSHIGWLLCKKHPEVYAKGKTLDLSDLYNDPIVMFQLKHYLILMPMICFILPTLIPIYCWNETANNAWYVATIFRWWFQTNSIFGLNSVGHMFGNRPYEKNINPVQNLGLAIFTFGEGWHNYHHVFPWDYRAAEWGNYSLNFTTAFIDFFAKIGWAYDLKTVAPETVKKRAARTGDGSYNGNVWGWDDKDLKLEHKQNVVISKRN